MVQHLVDRAIIERRAQGNCRYDWVCVLAAWHWFSFSNELCITSCVVLRPSDKKNSDVIALLNCVLVCRGSWHGHAKQFVRDFMAPCYFLSSSAAFAKLASNRHTQIAMVFCILSLFLPSPSSSSLRDTESLHFRAIGIVCMWLLGRILFTAAGALSARRPSRLHFSAKLVSALRQCLPQHQSSLVRHLSCGTPSDQA